MKQILAAAVTDKKIATKFNAVAFMTAHPASLVTPGTVIRALAVRRIQRVRRQRAETSQVREKSGPGRRSGVPRGRIAEGRPQPILLLHRKVRAHQLHGVAFERLRDGFDRGILAQQHKRRSPRRHVTFHRLEHRGVDASLAELLGE
jgi:hypothetical protein